MNKWNFNMMLFSRLSEVLDISGAEIARRCGMTQQVLNRYMNNDIVLSVQGLIQICNALRMPAHYFVSEQNNFVIPPRECATIPLDRWMPIEWNRQSVELTFGDGEGRIYWKDVARVLKVTTQKPHDRFLLKTRFAIDGFMAVCSHFDISPYKFLIDRNRKGVKLHNDQSRTRAIEKSNFFQEICELKQHISQLDATVSELTEKYNALLEKHNRLEQNTKIILEQNCVSCMVAESAQK